ncbi:cupin domain-containing protein [Pikeienuella piscinae]|uniref:Cupin domain-containing protein n=1 Tax=Pikeienuella piscinae TaxID=2748098 RepID=A0A7L5BST1_9RHOB|nr:cupin domain-containing protein [Pikeienuella piscinae]QIE54042.1 cupin domain-containing protein [Pikeienuella piscinae]
MSVSLAPVVHGPGAGEENRAFGLRRWFRIPAAAVGGAFSVFEEEIPEGAGPPLHIHHDAREFFVVTEGRVRFHCEGEEVEAGPGFTVLIPAGARHTFRGLGPGTSRALITLTPGAGEGLFRDVAAEALSPERDMPRILELAARYKLEFVGPPLA